VAAIPTEGTRLAEISRYFPGVSAGDLRRSLDYSRSARNLFDIHKHNEWTSYVPVKRLVRSINLVRDNPFAWVQLGAYLSLNHHTEGAIMATVRGLQAVDEKCPAEACPDDFQRLRATGRINLAIYLADAERPLEALLSLDAMDPAKLPPLEQLAYHWTSVQVKSALGDVDGATAALAAAAAVTLPDEAILRKTYSQYFNKRDAIQLYLAGVVALAADQPETAEQKAKEAIGLDRELWDAHLLLANVQYGAGHYGTCIETLSGMVEKWRDSHEIFRPERISYNLGNAYLAQYDKPPATASTGSKNPRNVDDLDLARSKFVDAVNFVEKRFKKEQEQTRLAEVFELNRNREEDGQETSGNVPADHEPAAAGRFFLDALAATSPFYADACNNLGTVYERLADRTTNNPRARRNYYAEAEAQWRRALRDHHWPRRHLAYGNLAKLYAKTGRFSSAAEAADAALSADPFNVVPLQALLDPLNEDRTKASVEAAQIAGWLISQRRQAYPIGIFDEFLAPYEKILRKPPSKDATHQTLNDAIRQTLYVLQYARATDEEVEEGILNQARSEFRTWRWPAIEMARKDLAGGGDVTKAWESIPKLEGGPTELGNWLFMREQGDVSLLHAEVLRRQGEYQEARREIERALAGGVDRFAVDELRMRIKEELDKEKKPVVSSAAVLPFDTIYSEEKNRIGHSLASSLSTILRGARSPLLRSLDRGALDTADWNAQPAIEIGRLSGVGAVISGRYARSRKLILLDVRISDSVSGEELFAKAYETPHANLRNVVAQIAGDVLNALRLEPRAPVEEVAATTFSDNGEAYDEYLRGMDILLSDYPAGVRGLRRARSLFESAIKRDATFARAHAGRALTLYKLASLYVNPTDVMNDAEEAADTAVRLPPKSAEAQLATALVRTWYAWKLKDGKAAFDNALELDPCNSTIHRLRGDYFAALGAFETALAEKKRAMKLAPLSADASAEAAYVLFLQGKWEEALTQADVALTLNPTLASACELKSWVYTKQGNYDDALDALDAAIVRSENQTPQQLAHRGVIHALRREVADTELVLAELAKLARDKNNYVPPLLVAHVLAAKGDTEAALLKLLDAKREQPEAIVWLGVDPWLESLRGKKSFDELRNEVDASGGETLTANTPAAGPCHADSTSF